MENVWDHIRYHARLSEESKQAWEKIMIRKEYKKGEYFIKEGEIPTSAAFIVKGLFYMFYYSKHGRPRIRKFFLEKSLMSTNIAFAGESPAIRHVRALEDCVTWEFNYTDFDALASTHADIARFHRHYMVAEFVWSNKDDRMDELDGTARLAYIKFQEEYPSLQARLEPQVIAAYLKILPEELDRLRNELN